MDNLFIQAEGADTQVPNYLLSADNHNVGNTLGGSWFDPDTWETKFSNAGKFIATSVLSGADSLYNTATTVGSWAGISEGPHDTGNWISSLDDSLGNYYAQNREAVDLVGFVATSFIPGLGGIKFLNAGQTALKAGMRSGAIGSNLARATGLLVPETELFITASAREIAASSGAINTLNTNTIRALGSGVYQNVLEAAAFETAVQATMFKSPILNEQDGWDIAKNIAFGGIVGGVIGGAITGASTVGAIKRFTQGELVASKDFSNRVIPATATSADQKIILTAESRDLRAVPVELSGEIYPLGTNNAAANKRLYASTVEKDNNAIRENINALVSGTDGTIGNMTADALYNAPASQMLNSLLHANEIGTIGKLSVIEQTMNKAIKALDIETAKGLEVRYIKLTGEGIGDVLDSAPILHNIADTVKTTSLRNTQSAVDDIVRGFKFKTADIWDAVALTGKTSHTEAEARYIWASSEKLLPKIKDGTIIHERDLPLLERVRSDLAEGKINLLISISIVI